jgi:small basic protein (TIGR04137 family)
MPETGYSLRSFFTENLTKTFMSQHRSLRAASTLGGKRNVLKRFERTALLEKRGQRKAGDRITGLRKTKPEA